MKKTIAAGLVILAIISLTACGSKTATGTGNAANTAVVSNAAGSGADIRPDAAASSDTGADTRGNFVFGDYVGNVDPASGAYAWVGMRTGVMESLFRFDENLNVEKNLVEEYSVSDDGRTWTIELRDGVLFQSGNPMDAEAVKASLLRTCSLQSRAAQELNIKDHNQHAESGFAKLSVRPVFRHCGCEEPG